MKRAPGTFQDHGNSLEYVAVSRAYKAANIPAHQITDAISKGTLPVHEINGCRCVTLADLVRIKEGAK